MKKQDDAYNQEIFCNGGVHGLMVIDKRDYNKVWGLGMK